MTRTLVIDVDGPILDVAGRHYAVYSDLARESGFIPLARDRYWECKRLPLGARGILRLSEAEALYEHFAKRWLECIELEPYLRLDEMQPGAMEWLGRSREAGYRIVLATMRQDAGALHRQLTSLNVTPTVDAIVVCNRTAGGIGKADAVAGAIGAAQNEVWLGDTEVDIEAARARGSLAWALSCGLRNDSFLASKSPDRLNVFLRDVALPEVPLRQR